MRLLAVFLLVVPAFAQSEAPVDPFVTALQVFEAARPQTLNAGAPAKVLPAVEGLVATGDVRAVRPLAQFLVETFDLELKLVELSQRAQQQGLVAHDRMNVLDKELSQLRLKERAGDTSAGPRIQKRIDEMRRQEQRFEEMKAETMRILRATSFVEELREKLAVGCATLLEALEDEQASRGLGELREILDIARRPQALFLVRILRLSELPQAEEHLLGILSHPKADSAVTRAASYALAKNLSPQGARALIGHWERNPEEMGERVRHVLGLTARRNFASLADARAWVASLED